MAGHGQVSPVQHAWHMVPVGGNRRNACKARKSPPTFVSQMHFALFLSIPEAFSAHKDLSES